MVGNFHGFKFSLILLDRLIHKTLLNCSYMLSVGMSQNMNLWNRLSFPDHGILTSQK